MLFPPPPLPPTNGERSDEDGEDWDGADRVADPSSSVLLASYLCIVVFPPFLFWFKIGRTGAFLSDCLLLALGLEQVVMNRGGGTVVSFFQTMVGLLSPEGKKEEGMNLSRPKVHGAEK